MGAGRLPMGLLRRFRHRYQPLLSLPNQLNLILRTTTATPTYVTRRAPTLHRCRPAPPPLPTRKEVAPVPVDSKLNVPMLIWD